MEIGFIYIFGVLLLAWVGGGIASRLGYPPVLGELIVGVLFGPPIFALLHTNTAIQVLAEIGVFFLMLYIGLEVEPRQLRRATGAGLSAALGGFLTPFVFGYGLGIGHGWTVMESLILGLGLGVTSLAVVSRLLVDMQLVETRLTSIFMAGAVVSDTLALLVFALLLGIAQKGRFDLGDTALFAGKALLFFGVTAIIGSQALPYIGRYLQKIGFTSRTANFTLVLLFALVFAEMAELAELHAVLGAFLAGVFLHEGVIHRKVSQELNSLVHDLSIGFLTPIFFVTLGFRVVIDVVRTQWGFLLLVAGMATLGKLLGTLLFHLPYSRNWRESLVLGIGMNGRGGVDMIIAGIALEAGMISPEVFSILVLNAILTTATVPILFRLAGRFLVQEAWLHAPDPSRRVIVIVGAGPFARALALRIQMFAPVWLIDSNLRHCQEAERAGLLVIHGNALQEATLLQAHALEARTLIAMTPNLEINVLVAQFAREEFFIPDVRVVLTSEQSGMYTDILNRIRVQPAFAGTVPLEDWDRWFDLGTIEWATLPVSASQAAVSDVVRSVFPEGWVLPVFVERGGNVHIYSPDMPLREGDVLWVVRSAQSPAVQRDPFDRLIARAVILDLDTAMDFDDFFQEVARHMAPRVGLSVDALYRKLRDRETSSTTVLTPFLAVPHVMVERPHTFEILVARSRNGIRFPGTDTGVHTVFVLIGSPEERNLHLRALSAIAQIVQNEDFESRWLQARHAEELRQILLRAKRQRF